LQSINIEDADICTVVSNHHLTGVDDLELFLSSHPNRNLSLTPLSLDILQCYLISAKFEHIQFLFMESYCPFRARGEKVPGYLTFGFILSASRQLPISHGVEVSEDYVYGFDPSREVNLVVPPQVGHCIVRIKRSMFEEFLEIMGCSDDISERLFAHNFLYVPDKLLPVKAYLSQLCSLAHQISQPPQASLIEQFVLEDFIPLLINAVSSTTTSVKPSSFANRSQLVFQAEDYIMAHLDKPLTLKDLCYALNISKRPLFYGFQEIFGMGPMAYLKVQRLRTVRRALIAASPEITSVTAIAQQYGFWSAGHFARDYKRMFGELPSETIKK
jgi:AraC family ethanolamine operon transcriptional activator